MADIPLMFANRFILGHKRKPKSGDKGKTIAGLPMVKCIRKGNGNIAAPAIDREYEKISRTGQTLNWSCRHARKSPTMNTTLKNELSMRPAENRYCDFVPIVPSSLTCLER